MKFLFETFPVIIFFVAFKVFDIYVATFAAMAASIAQIGFLLAAKRKVDSMQWVGLALITIFGGLTIGLKDENFIKLKPTILYWLFAGTLFFSTIVFKKNLIKKAMSDKIQLKPEFKDRQWNQLNVSWILFFIAMGALNLLIAHQFSSDTWTNFKLGSIGILFVFVILQGVWLGKYIQEEDSK